MLAFRKCADWNSAKICTFGKAFYFFARNNNSSRNSWHNQLSSPVIETSALGSLLAKTRLFQFMDTILSLLFSHAWSNTFPDFALFFPHSLPLPTKIVKRKGETVVNLGEGEGRRSWKVRSGLKWWLTYNMRSCLDLSRPRDRKWFKTKSAKSDGAEKDGRERRSGAFPSYSFPSHHSRSASSLVSSFSLIMLRVRLFLIGRKSLWGRQIALTLRDNARRVKGQLHVPGICFKMLTTQMLTIKVNIATIGNKYSKYGPCRQTIVLEESFNVSDRKRFDIYSMKMYRFRR